MSLLAMLLALLIERALSTVRGGAGLALPAWNLPPALRRLPAVASAGILAGAAGIALLASLIDAAPLRLAFAVAVLLVCLGPRDLADDVQRLRAARSRGDRATVARLTRLLQSGPTPDADHRSLLGALFIQSHERRFGVLLWFLALGPAGAVLYRLASRLPALLEAPDEAGGATPPPLLHALLAWIPARLTAGLFGLTGSLDDALLAWRRIAAEARAATPPAPWTARTWALLAEVANAALDWEDAPGGGPMISSSLDATLAEVLRMERRATLILLAITAVFTAGVWVA